MHKVNLLFPVTAQHKRIFVMHLGYECRDKEPLKKSHSSDDDFASSGDTKKGFAKKIFRVWNALAS